MRAHVLDHPGSNKVGAERFDIFSIEIERIRDLGSRRSQRMHVEPLQDSHVIACVLGRSLGGWDARSELVRRAGVR